MRVKPEHGCFLSPTLHKNNFRNLVHLKVGREATLAQLVLRSHQDLVRASASGRHGRGRALVQEHLAPNPLVHVHLQVAVIISVAITAKGSPRWAESRVQVTYKLARNRLGQDHAQIGRVRAQTDAQVYLVLGEIDLLAWTRGCCPPLIWKTGKPRSESTMGTLAMSPLTPA